MSCFRVVADVGRDADADGVDWAYQRRVVEKGIFFPSTSRLEAP